MSQLGSLLRSSLALTMGLPAVLLQAHRAMSVHLTISSRVGCICGVLSLLCCSAQNASLRPVVYERSAIARFKVVGLILSIRLRVLTWVSWTRAPLHYERPKREGSLASTQVPKTPHVDHRPRGDASVTNVCWDHNPKPRSSLERTMILALSGTLRKEREVLLR